MKPGEQLLVVNSLYPYTVQFKEDTTGSQGATKRPPEPVKENGGSQRETDCLKAGQLTEKVAAAVIPGEATKTSVRRNKEIYNLCLIIPIIVADLESFYLNIHSHNSC